MHVMEWGENLSWCGGRLWKNQTQLIVVGGSENDGKLDNKIR